jgi:hypothetical protein
MDTHILPLWAQLLGILYMGTGVFRLACHLPQARRCNDSPVAAQAVSLMTWCGLLACASIAFLYAVMVVRDWPLMFSTGCNVVGPVLVIASAIRARRRMATII